MKKLLFLCFCFLGCMSHTNQRLEEALEISGNNREELEKVLVHYQKDTLKLRAAKFLIENMPGCYSFSEDIVKTCQPFYERYDSLAKIYHYQMNKERGEKIDSLWKSFFSKKKSLLTYSIIPDLKKISSEQLIAEIDLSFKAWKNNVYTKNLSFEDFCEYILPYRYKNGMLIDNSREIFSKRHKNNYFSKLGKEMIQEVDSLLYKYKNLIHSQFWGTKIPILNVSTLEKLQRGTCSQRAWFNTLLLSSLGMAVAIDFVPVWGNRNNSHMWNVLIKDGKSYAFESFWDYDRWKYKKIYNNECIDNMWGKFRLPKVYRRCFSNHFRGPIIDDRVKLENIPKLFCDFKMKDVSNEYFETKDITLKLNNIPIDTYYAYICVFNNQKWQPVQCGKIMDNKVTFKGMGRDIVYLPIFYKNNSVLPAFPVFLLTSNGNIHRLSGGDEKISFSVNQLRGASSYDFNRKKIHSLKHITILGKKKTKESYDILGETPNYIPMESKSYKLSSRDKYKEVVLKFNMDTIALSEVSFYDKTFSKIKISRIELNSNADSNRKLLYDENLITGLQFVPKNAQLRVFFDTEQALSMIKLTPLIKSQIKENYSYRLYYWSNEWLPVNTKVIKKDGFLTFHNVPADRVYLIRESTPKGNNIRSRIFIYNAGEAIPY